MPLKSNIITLLEELAGYMELNGENKFKVRAYRNAADALKELDEDIEELIKEDRLKNVKGIGKGILGVINEYTENGNSLYLEELQNNIPPGLLQVMHVKGVGAQKAKLLFEELQVSDLDSLETACRNNSIATLKGFGEKSQTKILNDLERIKRNFGYHLLHKSLAKSEAILANLLNNKYVIVGELTGELRRKKEVISRLEFLLLVSDKDKFTHFLTDKYIVIESSNLKTISKYIIDDESGYEIIFYLIDDKEKYEEALFETTGSDEFLKSYYTHHQKKDIKEKKGAGFIIPEMREQEYYGAPEILRKNSDLESEKLKGMLHFHTTFSDGLSSPEEMVKAGTEKGYKYFAICDHSKAAFYAKGLKEERVIEQREVIDQLNKDLGITIFHGIECDILSDGKLDYDDDFLNNFDFVVASIHSLFSQSESEMTTRIIKAIENLNTDVLAHPTGRLLLSRDGYKVKC